MNQQDTPRFEFRLFGNAICEGVVAALQHEVVERRAIQRDIYLLSEAMTEINMKIRANKLNTKRLMRRQQGLEYWHPHLDIPFPLTAPFLHEILLPLLHVPHASLAQQVYSAHEFLALMQATAGVQVVQVHKQRHHYTVDGCQIELSTLYVGNQFYTRTVALEAVDPALLQSMRAKLGLLESENVNYGVGLKRLLQENPLLAETVVTAASVPSAHTLYEFV